MNLHEQATQHGVYALLHHDCSGRSACIAHQYSVKGKGTADCAYVGGDETRACKPCAKRRASPRRPSTGMRKPMCSTSRIFFRGAFCAANTAALAFHSSAFWMRAVRPSVSGTAAGKEADSRSISSRVDSRGRVLHETHVWLPAATAAASTTTNSSNSTITVV